jgi:hypothetical protein
MTAQDWLFVEWLMAQLHTQAWQQPWVVTFEYGGVGSLWGAVTERDVLAEQIPRLYKLIKE